MPDANSPSHIVADHIEETIRSVARLRAEHQGNATPHERAVDGITGLLSRPGFISILTVVIGGWIGLNLLAAALGQRPIDPPPFPWLGGAIALISLYMVVMILGAQRHDDKLAEYREMLALELAVLSEQKMAKVIRLLEEIRRDNPHIHDRVDHEADAMAQPANPQAVLDTIKGKLVPAK